MVEKKTVKLFAVDLVEAQGGAVHPQVADLDASFARLVSVLALEA